MNIFLFTFPLVFERNFVLEHPEFFTPISEVPQFSKLNKNFPTLTNYSSLQVSKMIIKVLRENKILVL